MNGTHARRGTRRWRWGLAGAALGLALAAWCVRSAVSVGDAGVEPSGGTGGGSTSGAPATTGPDRARLGAVARTVAARNEENAREEAAFRQAGWTLVAAPPPDPQLTGLDPALLDGRERELRFQLASTVPPPALAPRVAEIARRAREAATRVAAVEALGRMRTPAAQQALLGLIDALPPDDEARRMIVPLLRPAALDDAFATRLAAELDSPSLTPTEKQQLAFTLALVGLRDGMKLPDGAVSPAGRRLIDGMRALAQRGADETQGGGP